MNPLAHLSCRLLALFAALASVGPVLCAQRAANPPVSVDISGLGSESGARAGLLRDGKVLQLTWPASNGASGLLALNLDPKRPLFDTIGIIPADGEVRAILRGVEPLTLLTIGERDLKHAAGWVAFFDNPPLRPHHTVAAKLSRKNVSMTSDGARTIVRIGEVTAGDFQGVLEISVWRGSPLVHVETVLATKANGRAILYDAGLFTPGPSGKSKPWLDPEATTHSPLAPGAAWKRLAWRDVRGVLQRTPAGLSDRVAGSLQVRGRALAAENNGASLAVFPPPHQYFAPLDFANNLGFVWHGTARNVLWTGHGFGIRQPLEGDRIWVPWVNAPPGTQQRLGVFYLLSAGEASEALDAVSRYTRDDRYKPLPGHATMTSHYHVEHTLQFAKAQLDQKTTGVPAGLERPGFVEVFKERGVDILHLAEFHVGAMPSLPAEERLPLLKTMHEECERLSNASGVLILPGEEPNVHLGGHWLSFFPKPVYWVLNRAPGEPFEETRPGYGTVYRVGSSEDVLRLMEKENGLMWTAHPRIKGSMRFPDAYWNEPFFRSPRFIGAAWKAMPSDLSQPRLGTRVLDLLDDMSNAGLRKHVLGEADLFRIEPGYETYAHMNVNYLRIPRAPRFGEGWHSVLSALQNGQFFTTTGEVLINAFTVAGKESGAVARIPSDGGMTVAFELEWTFPLAFAEIISGDGEKNYRERVNLSATQEFGRRAFTLPLNLAGRRWVRLEVWDAACNGAFTQPVWLE